jgi:hypothetical protein
VTINGDPIVELDEFFEVELGSPSFDVSGIGAFVDFEYVDGNAENDTFHTIANDDTASLTIVPIGDVNEGVGSILVQVELQERVDYEVVVELFTSSGTATAGADYQATYEELVFLPSTSAFQQLEYEIPIHDDELVEAAIENFSVMIVRVLAAGREADISISAARTVGIIDNDTAEISIGDVGNYEGTGIVGNNPFVFTVTFSKRVDTSFTFTYSTIAYSAMAGGDFVAVITPVTVTVPAYTDSLTITIFVVDDAVAEGDDTFGVVLAGITVAGGRAIAFGDDEGLGTIVNDD